MSSKEGDGNCKVVLDGCFENNSEFIEGTYGKVRDRVNESESQQGVQQNTQFGDRDVGASDVVGRFKFSTSESPSVQVEGSESALEGLG